MEKPIQGLTELGITDADILTVDVIELEDGGCECLWEFTEEANAIIEAYCHRMKTTPEELLKLLVLPENGQ